MYSWSVASDGTSIMYDVLTAIDLANKNKVGHPCIDMPHSLLKRQTFDQYSHIFDMARTYDDSISAAMLLCEDPIDKIKGVILYKMLLFQSVSFTSFEDLVLYLHTVDRATSSEKILRACLYSERAVIPEDAIPLLIESQNMFTVDLLNTTKLPQRIKFSLTTLLFNFVGIIYFF